MTAELSRAQSQKLSQTETDEQVFPGQRISMRKGTAAWFRGCWRGKKRFCWVVKFEKTCRKWKGAVS